MKYINTPKDMDYKLCPLCKQNNTHISNVVCKACRDAYNERENNLELEEWVILNKWCRRLPYFADVFIKCKIWKFYDIDTYGKPFSIFVVVLAILFFLACVVGWLAACIVAVS